MTFLAALLLRSPAAQLVAVALVTYVSVKSWKTYERYKGAEAVRQEITVEADKKAKQADEIRADTADGRVTSRVRNPFERPSN